MPTPVKISALPGASPLTGSEQIASNQAGTTVKSTLNELAQFIQIQPINGLSLLLAGLVDGLNLNFNTVAIVDVEAGTIQDSTDVKIITLSGTKTANIALSGAGGLDTGSEAADTWYAIHVIGDTTETNASDVILSTSATAPTLPGTHDIFRRVGWVRNNSSSDFLKFTQNGATRIRLYQYDEPRSGLSVLSGGSAILFTTISAESFAPPTSRFSVVSVDWNPKSAGNEFVIRPTDHTTSLVNYPWRYRTEVKTSTDWRDQISLFLDVDQKFDFAVTSSNDSLGIFVIWFEDKI